MGLHVPRQVILSTKTHGRAPDDPAEVGFGAVDQSMPREVFVGNKSCAADVTKVLFRAMPAKSYKTSTATYYISALRFSLFLFLFSRFPPLSVSQSITTS